MKTMSKFKMDTVYIAITNDLNYLAHYGVPGQEWYVNKAERYQNHAQYAKYDKRYQDPYMQAAKERMNSEHGFTDWNYEDDTADNVKSIPVENYKDLKRLTGKEDIQEVRMNINHPDDGTDYGRGYNCPNCALAFEMTERGYDVIARPKVYRSNVENVEDFFKDGKLTPVFPDDNPYDIFGKHDKIKAVESEYDGKINYFNRGTYKKKHDAARNDYWNSVGQAVQDSCNKAIETILNQGNGARGIFVEGFMDSDNPRKRTTAYHAFNYKVENGKVRFYDVEGRRISNQNGDTWIDVDSIDPRELYIMRTDNLQLSPSCTRGVYSNRGIKY